MVCKENLEFYEVVISDNFQQKCNIVFCGQTGSLGWVSAAGYATLLPVEVRDAWMLHSSG